MSADRGDEIARSERSQAITVEAEYVDRLQREVDYQLCKRQELMIEHGRLREFAEWVAGYESERQLVGSGVIEKAKKALR